MIWTHHLATNLQGQHPPQLEIGLYATPRAGGTGWVQAANECHHLMWFYEIAFYSSCGAARPSTLTGEI